MMRTGRGPWWLNQGLFKQFDRIAESDDLKQLMEIEHYKLFGITIRHDKIRDKSIYDGKYYYNRTTIPSEFDEDVEVSYESTLDILSLMFGRKDIGGNDLKSVDVSYKIIDAKMTITDGKRSIVFKYNSRNDSFEYKPEGWEKAIRIEAESMPAIHYVTDYMYVFNNILYLSGRDEKQMKLFVDHQKYWKEEKGAYVFNGK